MPLLNLVVALLLLALWVVYGFILPVAVGAIHLLLAIAAILLVRWWALRDMTGER